MDFVPGVKLIDAVVSNAEELSRRLGISVKELEQQSINPSFSFQAKYLWTSLIYKSYGFSVGLFNATCGYFTTPLVKPVRLLNVPKLYKQLVDIHGKQFLIDGCFNGDPHPGNILVTPSGHLGLVDFGQVKRVSEQDRHNSAQLMKLLLRGESAKDQVVSFATNMGFKTEKMDPFVMYKTCVIAFDRDDEGITEGN